MLLIGLIAAAWVRAEQPTRVVANQLGLPRTRPQLIAIADRKLELDALKVSEGGAGVPRIVKRIRDPILGSWVHTVELGAVTGERVQLTVDGVSSRRIALARDDYRALQRSLLRSYYLQRCGIAIRDLLGGQGDHAACHRADGVRAHADAGGAQDAAITAPGGWHDAGDFGKYTSTTATVVLELLTRYERFPGLLAEDDLKIPESGNNTPDLLDEMRVGLDWMLAMQRSDGAVYRKLSGAAWSKQGPPETDTQKRFVYGVTSPDSAKAAAAWALAARVYRAHDPVLADRYLKAARATWAWLVTQRDQVFDFVDGDNSGSGPYMGNKTDREKSLLTDRDDRLAAAIELYLTTHEPAFARVIDELLPSYELTMFEWKDVASLSVSSLLWHPAAATQARWKRTAASKLRARAEQARARSQQHPFSIANHRIVWGSNKMTAEEGVLMLAAARLGDRTRLQSAAWSQLHYLLGANPLDKVFVSGFGDNPVAHVSHLFLRAVGRTIPGLFVGGPNELEQSNIGPRNRGLLSYADDARSYATNEYAIDYDSALIALLIDLSATELSPYSTATQKKPDGPAGTAVAH